MGFGRHDTYAGLSVAERDGVVVRDLGGGRGEVRFAPSATPPHTATDLQNLYAGGRYHWGALTSPVHRTSTRFDALIPSWNADTPAGTWMQLEVQVRSNASWTPWFNLGIWASGTGDVKRHSVHGQRAGSWRVLTDTLESTGQVFAGAYRYRLKLFTKEWGIAPTVRGVYVAVSDSRREEDADTGMWGRELAVPARSQMVYPGGGEAWCSPASLAMVMAYWATEIGDTDLNLAVPEVAAGTYDYVYEGNGNWAFNAAYASSFGLRASVNRMRSLGQVERWVGARVPVVASIAWDNREGGLAGAPLTRSDGHLLVVRGFTLSGDVVVNDPAGAGDSQVRRVYDRAQFARAWFSGSGGAVYLVYPGGWSIPGEGSW